MNANTLAKGKPSFLERSINWLCLLAAALITFFVSPLLYSASVDAVWSFADANYGFLTSIIDPLWRVIVMAALFLSFNLAIKTAATGGFVTLVKRFL